MSLESPSTLVGRAIPPLCEPSELTPLWNLIFEEARSENHLLFSPNEILLFEGSLAATETFNKAGLESETLDASRILTLGKNFFASVTYREAVSFLDELDLHERALVYHLYRRWLKNMRQNARQSLH